jgi:hypothetical protein
MTSGYSLFVRTAVVAAVLEVNLLLETAAKVIAVTTASVVIARAAARTGIAVTMAPEASDSATVERAAVAQPLDLTEARHHQGTVVVLLLLFGENNKGDEHDEGNLNGSVDRHVD